MVTSIIGKKLKFGSREIVDVKISAAIEKVTYKGYTSQVMWSFANKIYHGKIEGINDLITFECKSLDEVEGAFQEAVDDYLSMCKENGWEPNKSNKTE